MELLVSLVAGLVLLSGLFWTWNAAKRALSLDDAIIAPPAGVYSRESSEEAYYRARRLRRRAEHDAWEGEYGRLLGAHAAGCPDCGAPARRSSRRAVFF